MDSIPGTQDPPTLDGYSVERELGRGGTSSVYEIRDNATGETSALKVGPVGAAVPRALLTREVEVLRGVAHPHLVRVNGTADTSRGAGVLMEFMPGGSAADLVAARGPIPLGEAVTILAPIAQALAALHGSGAMHGDVAPGNILFTGEGMPKLGDLGLASLVGRPGARGGTPGFAAPEVTGPGAEKSIEPARDVFSLGAVAWYVLTGRTPAPTSHRPPLGSLVPSVPDEFSMLVEECLQEDPDLRPSADAVALRVFSGTAPEPVSLTESVHPAAMGHMVTQLVGDAAGKRRRWDPRRRFRNGARASHAASTTGRRRNLALAALTVVLVAGGAAWSAVRPDAAGGPTADSPATTSPADPSPASPTAPPTSREQPSPVAGSAAAIPEDPGRAAAALATLRDAALAAADEDALRGIHHAEGTSLAADRETVRTLIADGIRYDGLSTELSSIAVLPGATAVSAGVEATSTMAPYRVLDGSGRTVDTVPNAKVQGIVLELRRSEGRWLIFRVVQDSDGA